MRTFCCLLLPVLCMTGCGKPSLAGKWSVTGSKTVTAKSATAEFKDDTFTLDTAVGSGRASIKVIASGDYTFDGKKLTMTTTAVRIDDPRLQGGGSSFQKFLEKTMLKTTESDIKIENDSFKFGSGDSQLTFTRGK
ncbi:MAG: hypothetical protein JST12_04935 [Armatimonadetes bacterium]|nr:hypothetical protein [Armatimonadota bacterium]